MTRLFSFLMLAALPSLLAAQESPTSSSCPCTLRGTVINSVTGVPVPGALVQTSSAKQPAMLTDSEGAFHFDGLPAGTLSVSASKPGFLPQNPFLPQSTSVAVGPDAPSAVIKLTPGGVLTGRVLDENGEPLENFNIQLVRRAPAGGDLYVFNLNSKVFSTNDLGIFRVPDLPAGSYFLLVSPPNLQSILSSSGGPPQIHPSLYYPGVPDSSAATALKITAGHETQANFTLSAKPAIRLSGTVSGILSGGNVAFSLSGLSQFARALPVNFDQRTGAFQTGWIPPGTYHLNAQSVDSSQSGANVVDAQRIAQLTVTAESTMTGIHLALLPNVIIPLRIHGLSHPEESNQIMIYASAKGPGVGGQPLPKRNPQNLREFLRDSYELSLAPGTYRLEVTPYMDESYYIDSATLGSANVLGQDFLVDSSSARSTIDIVLRKGAAAFSGTVTAMDASHGAFVCLFPPSSGGRPFFAFADHGGSFKFDHLAPGSYRAAAVDGLIDPDPANQELLKKLSSAAKEFSLAPEQSLSLALEITRVQD